jgi:hypothetical protein
VADPNISSGVPPWEPRVAVLEQIARDTQRSLERIEHDLRDLRADFRWVMTIMLAGFVLTLGGIGGLGLATLPALHALGH